MMSETYLPDFLRYSSLALPASMRAVIGALEHKVERFFTREDIEVYFGDVVDHLDKIWDALDECKEVIEGRNDSHDSRAANRTNEVMRILTIFATIFIPLTFVAGIYGMNFEFMPELKWRWAYFALLGLMGVITIGMLRFFKKRGWF